MSSDVLAPLWPNIVRDAFAKSERCGRCMSVYIMYVFICIIYIYMYNIHVAVLITYISMCGAEKGGSVCVGCALFYGPSKFSIVHSFVLKASATLDMYVSMSIPVHMVEGSGKGLDA